MLAPARTLPISIARRFILGKQGLWPGRRWRVPWDRHARRAVEHASIHGVMNAART